MNEPQVARELLHGQNVQNFDRIVDQIVKHVSLQQKGDVFQLGVRLKPEFLGELRRETVMDGDRTMRAVIHAEDPSVRTLLEGRVATLIQRFDDLGIHVDKVEIQSLSTDGGSGNDSSKGRQGLGHSGNQNSPETARPEPGKTLDRNDSEIEDGHIHLFI